MPFIKVALTERRSSLHLNRLCLSIPLQRGSYAAIRFETKRQHPRIASEQFGLRI